MFLSIHNGDILFDKESDTIVLPIDANGPGLVGNLASQFMKAVGVEEMHELYAPPPSYPFNGDAHWSSLAHFPETGFDNLCVVGTLSHSLGANHKAYARSALEEVLGMGGCDPGFGQVIACPVITGGHRIPYVDAVFLMMNVIDRLNDCMVHELRIFEKDPEKFKILQSVARV
tara:strand:+ start:86 stop:604 length:519 start_codon:yes stop_codon:yes gene_type:complete